MKYIIERASLFVGWVRSDTYPNTYTYQQAKAIMRDGAVMYRMVPAVVLRQVTREEFLDTLVDEVKERLSFDIIHKYLSFPTTKRAGNTYNHIVSDSVYPIQTEKRTVRDGETLCGRRGRLYPVHENNGQSPCPGCLAIARGLAVRDLV